MFSTKTSTRIILKSILRAALAVCGAVIVAYVTSGRISVMANSIAEKKAASLFLQERSQAIADLRTQLTEIGANDAKLTRALPPDDNISEFLDTLKSTAEKNSLRSSIQTDLPGTLFEEGALSVSGIHYTMTLEGTVVTLERYLEAFEAIPYFSGITNLSISAPAGWEGNASISLGAILYARHVNL